MANVLQQWLKRLTAKSRPADKVREFRPRLEQLEERECPAIFNPVDAASLTTALNTANANNQADVINLVAGTNYSLLAALPAITQDTGNPANTLTINGNGATVSRAAAAATNFRIFNITDARVFISSLTMTGGIGDNGFGGGIRVSDAAGNNGTNDNLVLRNSTVSGNLASTNDGGGIFVSTGGKVTIINSTLSGNTAQVDGGGISVLNTAGLVNIVNSTITGNVAITAGNGGGVNVDGSTVNISNTIVSNNHTTSLAGPGSDLTRGGGTVNSRNSLYQTAPVAGVINGLNTGNVTGDPLLGPLQNNGGPTPTHAITSPGSPAVNTGSNALITAPDNVSDQRGPGFNRIINTIVDIGSYEFQPVATVTTVISSVNPSSFGQPVTFTATVAGAAPNSNIALGSVTFVIDGLPRATVALVNGTAALALNTLTVGNHVVVAIYNPQAANNNGFLTSTSAPLIQTVNVATVGFPAGRRWAR